MRVFTGLGEVRAAVGEHLGYSDYQVITQDDIDAFAALTGDDQWIHTDPGRAADGPFGGTIAHGLLTLSLGPRHAKSIYRIDGMAMSVNYGYDKIRSPSPVPACRLDLGTCDGPRISDFFIPGRIAKSPGFSIVSTLLDIGVQPAPRGRE